MVRQEPQCSGLADQPGRAVRSLAERARVRAFLRVHRRRHEPVAAERLSKEPSRSSPTWETRTTTSTMTLPTRRSSGSGCRSRSHPTGRSSAYYAPGATHAPHHPSKEWIEKYKGKFDQGWDKVREETFARQKKLGVIPADTKLTAAASRRFRRGIRFRPSRRRSSPG